MFLVVATMLYYTFKGAVPNPKTYVAPSPPKVAPTVEPTAAFENDGNLVMLLSVPAIFI